MIRIGLILALTAWIFTSCNSESSGSADIYKSDSTGKSGELIVVIPETDWKGASGKAIRKVFEEPVPHFFNREPQFDIDMIAPGGFGNLVKKFRNLILFEKKPDLTEAKIEVRESVWANDQIVVSILGPDTTAMLNALRQDAEKIKTAINEADRKHYEKVHKKQSSDKNKQLLKEKYGISLNMPSDFKMVREENGISWFRSETRRNTSSGSFQVMLNIVVSEQPYTSENQLTDSVIIASKTAITGSVIQSSNDSPLVIESYFEPTIAEVNHDGNYAKMLRGLWKFESPVMGGPISSITVHDPDNNRLITIDGFAFAPKFDMREYMKQLESIVLSVKY